MRQILIPFSLFLAVVISSCNSKKEIYTKHTQPFEFALEGEVKNGEGKIISLYIPSRGLDQRIKSKIQKGRYSFKGEAEYIENAEIRFEENIVNQSNTFSFRPVFIEPGTVRINFKVSGDSMLHYLDIIKVVNGSIDEFFYDTRTSFIDAYSTRIFADQKKTDSMDQFVYPKVRENTIRVYDSLYASNQAIDIQRCLYFS